jgi:hypothetical protein
MDRGQSATTFWTRLRGLIGHRRLNPNEGMLISPCRGVHTFCMRFPIDVVYVDRQGKVVGLAPELRPNRLGPVVRRAQFVLELPAGTIARTRTRIGDQIDIRAEEFA